MGPIGSQPPKGLSLPAQPWVVLVQLPRAMKMAKMKSNIAEKGLHSLLSLLTISRGPKMTLKALMGLNFQTQVFVFPK